MLFIFVADTRFESFLISENFSFSIADKVLLNPSFFPNIINGEKGMLSFPGIGLNVFIAAHSLSEIIPLRKRWGMDSAALAKSTGLSDRRVPFAMEAITPSSRFMSRMAACEKISATSQAEIFSISPSIRHFSFVRLKM